MTSNKRYICIIKAISKGYYSDLGEVDIMDESNLENIKITCIPHEGFHKNSKYTITIKFQGEESWPLVYIDSDIYDKIKTRQYIEDRGRFGKHKGICIKDLSHGYNFDRNFKKICGNKWSNYIYNVICLFNNIEDFEKGNGIKSTYKDVLSL